MKERFPLVLAFLAMILSCQTIQTDLQPQRPAALTPGTFTHDSLSREDVTQEIEYPELTLDIRKPDNTLFKGDFIPEEPEVALVDVPLAVFAYYSAPESASPPLTFSIPEPDGPEDPYRYDNWEDSFEQAALRQAQYDALLEMELLWREEQALREEGFGNGEVAASPYGESRAEEGPSREAESVVAGKAFMVGEASSSVTDNKVPPKKKVEKHPEKQVAVSREKAETVAGEEEAFLNKLQTSPKKVDKNQLDTTTQGRNVLARTGDDIEISLVNEGWLFLGYRDMKSADGIIFKSRQYNEGKTLFTFRAQRLGSYDLPFMYQDTHSGDQKKILISVSVLKDDEFEKKFSEEVNYDQEQYDLQYAERLIKLGNYKAALDEFLKARENNHEGSTYLNQRIAHLYYEMQKFPEAYSYWRQNTQAPEPFADLATVGIVSSSIEMGDHPGLLKNLTAFLNITALPIGRETLELARYLMSCGDRESARDSLLEYSRIHPEGEALDEVFYLLGQVYEEDREFKLAREAYTKVFSDYPGSALTVKAKERVQFLKRHFLYIQ